MSSYLPESAGGWLPYWLAFISVVSAGNTIQAYVTTKVSARLYDAPLQPTSSQSKSPQVQVTPLQSRTFGVWTTTSSVVRMYAAYNIHDKNIYQLAIATFAIAWGHFVSEWLVFKTAQLKAPLVQPMLVATASLLWTVLQYGYYVDD